MTENEFLERILERLGNAEGAEEIFGMDEVLSWSSEAADLFLKNELLCSTNPAKLIECKGCEQYCLMPVDIRLAENKQPARAFITCDKREDIGRVPVDLSRLKQWKITGQSLAERLSILFGFVNSPKEEEKNKRWVLGVFKGKKRRGHIALVIENRVLIQLAGHEVPVMELLRLDQGLFTVDQKELVYLVDKPLESTGYKFSTQRRESRELKTKERNEILKDLYRELKRDKPGQSDVWYSQQISKDLMSNDQKLSPETIRKNMKK